jgi:hypothetical protein
MRDVADSYIRTRHCELIDVILSDIDAVEGFFAAVPRYSA